MSSSSSASSSRVSMDHQPPVRILNVSHIPVPPPPYPAPGSTVALSLFDAFWIAHPPIQRLFLFPDADPGVPFSAIVGSLRSALARTLPFFHPFAGDLVYHPSPEAAVLVQCSSESAGVALIEAASDLKMVKLVGSPLQDSSLPRLVPDIAAGDLPAPVIAVQVTAFTGGGVAVGIAVHHAVADGRGFWRFVEALAAASRADGCGGSADEAPAPLATHDRAVIKVDQGKELSRRFWQHMAPSLPKIKPSLSPGKRPPLMRRTFTVTMAAVDVLKQRAVSQILAVFGRSGSSGGGEDSIRVAGPTTFVALAAHAWVSLAVAKVLASSDQPTVLTFLMDCRSRLKPPVPESFAGNCSRPVLAHASASEFAKSGEELGRACMAIEQAKKEAEREPLKDCEHWAENITALTRGDRTVIVSGSPKLAVYDTDFGWGKPGRVELLSMKHDGEVLLVAGKEEGTVQVSVALSGHQMDNFADIFHRGLNS